MKQPVALMAALAVLGACDRAATPDAAPKKVAEGEPETVDIPQTVTAVAPGTTPMAERVAVVGLLNKRNGLSRDLTLRPGQSVRIGDAVVRLRACETTAPWEVQTLTGAFVQLDVRNAQDRFQRVFSGWLYAETPSLNIVEHPIYDVWPKSCAMTHPGGAPEADSVASPSNRSSAPKSAAPAVPPETASEPEAAPEPEPAPAEPVADPSIPT